MKNTSPKSESTSKELRGDLIDAIMKRIEEQVDAVIPPEVSARAKKAILSEALPNALFILSGLSIRLLKLDEVVEPYVTQAVDMAEFFVKRIAEQKARA